MSQPAEPDNLLERAAAIRLVVLDVDGVLTDGRIVYDSTGAEIKAFNVKDGLGISKAVREGVELAIITARTSDMVSRRAAELGIQHVIQNTRTKAPALEQLVTDRQLPWQAVAYIGDDLPDLPCMALCGLAACPADAAREVQAACHVVANRNGGDGAVREILDFILEARQLIGA